MSTPALAPVLVTTTRRYARVSPLRYPGGKAALAGFFEDVIARLGLVRPRYVEPFAGGVGAGLALLQQNVVDELVINDIDPAVFHFWKSAIEATDAFAELICSARLTIDEWRHQRDVYRAADESDPLALGFAFFYLNRTNRSGVLNGGPIGGLAQTGTYRLDARFNREELVRRIEILGTLRNRIVIHDMDGRAIVRQYAGAADTFLYIDPPYLEKGGSLYLNSFTHRDHGLLARTVMDFVDANWIVTYDDADFIRSIYAGQDIREYGLHYSANKVGQATELMIASQSVAGVLTR